MTDLNTSELRDWIAEQIAAALGIAAAEVDADREFSEFGIDSLAAFTLTGDLSDKLGREFPATLFWEYPTISKLCAHLTDSDNQTTDSGAAASAAPILLAGRSSQPKLFAICGIDLYQNLANEVDEHVATYGVYVPPEKTLGVLGDGTDDHYAFTTVADLAGAYIEQIKSVDAEGPYVLAGLSFGGVLAYEVAQQLTEQGSEVSLVALLDSVLPTAVHVGFQRRIIDGIKRVLHKSRREEEAEQGYEAMGRLRGAYYWRLSQRYAPVSYNGNVLLFRAEESRLFGRGFIVRDDLGWADLTSGALDMEWVSATHTGILKQPHVADVASSLWERLRE